VPAGRGRDEQALADALGAEGEERIARLWEFVRRFPASPERERAFLALLDGGATDLAVCGYVDQNDPDLLRSGSLLAARCGR
jgi:hypothetical protein